jgi:hypothetical protein
LWKKRRSKDFILQNRQGFLSAGIKYRNSFIKFSGKGLKVT